MITRRAFLSALAALPLVGRWMPKTEAPLTRADTLAGFGRVYDPWVPMTVCPEEGGGEIFITSGGRGYVFRPSDPPFPTLAQYRNHSDYVKAFDEWDRAVQQPRRHQRA